MIPHFLPVRVAGWPTRRWKVDEDGEEIEAMAGVVDLAVGSAADQVAEGGEQLKEDGGGVGLGVGARARTTSPARP